MDTPDLVRRYCPECEPETDPLREIVVVSFCAQHWPSVSGIDDGLVLHVGYPLGVETEADGHACRAFAKLMEDQEHGRGQ